MKDVQTAYADCKAVIDAHSKTFAKAFSPLPKEKRQAVWAVYAFCRQADDIVDEGSEPEVELLQFRKAFRDFLEGDYDRSSSLWIALADVFERFPMSDAPFWDMIHGQEMDIEASVYGTLEDVETYAYFVASTVGLMLLPILAPERREELAEGAVALGKAMQLTNILRDVGEDLEMNRIYVPAELISRHGAEEAFHRKEATAPFILCWEEVAERAEVLYQKAFETMHLYPREARIPVKGSAYMYRAILNSVRKNEYDVFHKRAHVSLDEKEEIIQKLSSS
ncbi:phytoene synthase [Salsuginibacillus halophilus]|uniref:Phytoene synthase n=1 Tax=Salsuginibacillus halophilus TaxID=517424 RepID=A0A2P8HYA0_9BACI|nr:phytoene/squalene synthase family protein [Salsuginibacillus halophilus]PSL51134.1 phytoene synthase [Salsuginibacillus halophilus]